MTRIARQLAGIGAADLPNAAAFDGYTGPAREVTVDPGRGIVALHDGSTPGGKRLIIGAGSNGILPRGYLFGLDTANNATDATNDIDVSAGEAASDDTVPILLKLATAMTKQLDAVWTQGTNQGGRDSAVALADGTFYVWLIGKSTASDRDVLFSASPTSPNMPSGWDLKRLLIPIIRTGGAIKPYKQDGDQVTWTTPAQDLNAAANPGTSTVLRALTLPVGVRVLALFSASLNNTATASAALITDPATTDLAPSSANCHLFTSAVPSIPVLDANDFQVFTNQSAQVRTRLCVSNSNTALSILTKGFIFSRGR